MKSTNSMPLQDTLKSLEKALGEWEGISTKVESETEEFRKRTRELLVKLAEQIQALDL